MPRPRRDGTPPRGTIKRKLTDVFINSIKHTDRRCIYYDERVRGLCIIVQAKPSTTKSYAMLYYSHGSPRWMSLGRTNAIGLADARKMAAKVALQVANGGDPVAERLAARGRGTFAELAVQYRTEFAQVHNKSWKQAARLVEHYAVPRIGALAAALVTRADIKAMLKSRAPVLANQILASTSAVFAFGIREQLVEKNPCALIDRNPVNARERILANAEYKSFWTEFDEAGLEGLALRMVQLTCARPGEIIHMHSSQVIDGFWTLPGQPDLATGWLGTKNGETLKLWLSKPAQEIIAGLGKGALFAGADLGAAMRSINKKLGIENAVRPHDLRRSSASLIASKYGAEVMNRILNHRLSGVSGVYNRYNFANEDRVVMEALGQTILDLAHGRVPGENVVPIRG
jgi:integrase